MSLGESIRVNTLWIVTGNVSGRLLGFVIGIVLARLLVPADFGMLVTIHIFTGMVGYLAGGGMSEALVQAKRVVEDDYRIVFTMQLLICSGIYLGFFHFAPYFARWFDDPLYADLLRVSALNFLLRPFVNMPRARLRRQMRFKIIAINRFLSIVVSGLASVTMALYDMGPWSLVLGGLSGALLSLALYYHATRWRPGIRFRREAATRLGTYGVKMSANEILVYLRNQTSNLIISRLMGPAMVGLFNKADSLSTLPAQLLAGSTYQTVFRALSGVQENLDQSRYIYLRTMTLLTVYALPIYVGLLWLAEPFIVTVYGIKWVEAALPLQILALTGLFRCVVSPSGAVIAAQNRLGRELRIQVETWIVITIGCLAGLRWGIAGVAAGLVPGAVYLAVRMSWLANQCLGGRMRGQVAALLPALKLNGLLMLVFLGVHLALPAGLAQDRPPVYLAAMSGAGFLGYLVLFLYLPIPELRTEAGRWKRRLRLAAAGSAG